MIWYEICQAYLEQWLVVEALEAHTTDDNLRQLDRCNSGQEAMQTYRRLHNQYPGHEFYFLHISRKKLNIREIKWHGIQSSYAN